MGYAAKLGSSGGSNLEVKNCGNYIAYTASSTNLSNRTPKYASLRLGQSIFFGNLVKVWNTSGKTSDFGGRVTLSLNPSYNTSTGLLSWGRVSSYCASTEWDYLQFTLFIIV